MATLKVPHQVGDLGGYLKEQRESARLSLRQLATAAGVSNPYLSQIERGMRRPSAEVLQQIAKGLQISAEALFLRAGLLEDSRGLDVEVAVQSDVQLTARQKRVLLDIYATFRAENARFATESGTDAESSTDAESGTEAEPGSLKPSPPHAEGPGGGAETAAPASSTRKRAAAKAARVATTGGAANPGKQAASPANAANTVNAAKPAKKTARTTTATGIRTVGSRAVKSAASRSRTTTTTT